MVDAQLVPRILDFGISGGDPRSGHLRGTLAYISPEQLNPRAPIDARTDVYGLGAILYELLCGMPPYAGLDDLVRIDAIRRGQPRLPVEMDARVPEPLQAIALDGDGGGSGHAAIRPPWTWPRICVGSSTAVRFSRARQSMAPRSRSESVRT